MIMCDAPYVFLHRDGRLTALFRWALTDIDQYSTVSSSIFEFYVDERVREKDLDIEIYQVNKSWIECEADWVHSETGISWGQAGCNQITGDREATPIATLTLNSSETWYSTDLTALVQEWVDSPSTNYGLVIKGVSSESVMYLIASRDAAVLGTSNVNKIPRLYTVYATPTP